MRLSEAIRLGAMMKPQAFGETYQMVRAGGLRGLFGQKIQASCAFGAAMDANPLGVAPAIPGAPRESLRGDVSEVPSVVSVIPPEWVPVTASLRPCPLCGVSASGFKQIAHLNDYHKLTREQIADWVEGIENAQSTPATSREEVRTQEHAITTSASAAQKD